MAASGQNAVVFLIETDDGRHAVRCFLTPPPAGAQRYDALARHLEQRSARGLTPARWLKAGIRVNDVTWPIVVMPWVEGRPLNVAVEDLLEDDPASLTDLARQLIDIVVGLQAAEIAHGDLQHGNIMVTADGTIALVDLDGVWVPKITVGAPTEFGHPNYQHPHRTPSHWGRWVDSFPAALIELGLRALAADPSLDRYLNGENLLFARADLADPDSSAVWSALAASPDPWVAERAALLRHLCSQPIDAVMRRFGDIAEPPPEDKTVLRSDARPPGGSLPSVPSSAADTTEWWVDTASTVVRQSNATSSHAVPESPTSIDGGGARLVTPGHSTLSDVRDEHERTGETSRHRSIAVLGRNVVVAGGLGGALAGAIGSLATSAVDPVFSERAETVAFVAFISLALGGFLLSFQDLAGRNWLAALRRFLLGGVIGGVAGIAAIIPADVAVRAMAPDNGEVPITASMAIFAIVAGMVGWALGSLRSLRTGVTGLAAGATSGAVGGLLFGATVADFIDRELDVYYQSPVTVHVVAAVCASIGVVFGVAVRSRRAASLTIVEGRNAGIEISVEGARAVIGSSPRCDLVLRGDGNVQQQHVVVDLASSPPRCTALGAALLNGSPIEYPDTPLAHRDVLLVDGSFIRFEIKESRP
jgi:hypothetical protein